MSVLSRHFLALLGLVALIMATASEGFISKKTWSAIRKVNLDGPFLGLVVPNLYEMNPVLNSPSFSPNEKISYLDVQGRRFRFGSIGNQKVVMVMTGLSMLNAGLTVQLLLSLFQVKGIVHFGIAGNGNPDLEIGDVTIPQYWAHLSLWSWQRDGNGPGDELPLEANGDYTREHGFLNFSDYTIGANEKSRANSLNSIWYQPEEIFPINGTPEERQHAFWVRVSKRYFALAKNLEGMELPKCVNATTCLPRNPKVVRVERGCSANLFLDNADYRQFLRSKYGVTPIDMESAAIALISYQFQTPFITIRSLSDLAGGGSAIGNEASKFEDLAAQNAVRVMLQFVSLLDRKESVDNM